MFAERRPLHPPGSFPELFAVQSHLPCLVEMGAQRLVLHGVRYWEPSGNDCQLFAYGMKWAEFGQPTAVTLQSAS